MSAVQVAVRARPLSTREEELGSGPCLQMKGPLTTLYCTASAGVGQARREGPGARTTAKQFQFDYSYWSVDPRDEHYVGQEQVFTELGVPVVEAAFSGYNSCVFAYGQTASGKTYTMSGYGPEPGLIPRVCEGLYSRMKKNTAVSYKTEVSYLEIYNEKVRDLLVGEGGAGARPSLRVREHPREGPYVEGLSRHLVSGYSSIAALLEAGNTQRATASTKMNDKSSRSHAIFTLVLTQALYESGLPSETHSKLHLVDLAGSERASATGVEGDRLKEGSSINRSLVCLGTVISTLADKTTHPNNKKLYIPYRDSVLTWLLKDSLGGNAKTVMIATLSPAECSYGETLSTLRYANRAKSIINKPVVNEDANVKLIRELRAEIHQLKEIISSQKLDISAAPDNIASLSAMTLAEDIYKKEEQVAELTVEWARKWKDIWEIIQDRHVALHSEGAKMVVNSEQPHLVGLDPDILSTGLVFYYLQGESTTVGRDSTLTSSRQQLSSAGETQGEGKMEERKGEGRMGELEREGRMEEGKRARSSADIRVLGEDVEEEHCRLVVKRGKVVLHPLNGDCYINHCKVVSPSRLRQGDMLQLGQSTVFRFNHPQEAKRLRKRHSDGLLLAEKTASPEPRRRCGSESLSGGHAQPHPNSTHPTGHSGTQSTPHSSTRSTPDSVVEPQSRSHSVMVELQSCAVLKASSHPQPASSSLTVPRPNMDSQKKLQATHSLNPVSLVKRGLSRALYSQVGEEAEREDEVQHTSRWQRWLYSAVLLLNTPLLMVVVGVVTLPAFSMLALLLSLVKVFAAVQRVWLFRWPAVLVGVVTAVLVAPVAGLCDLLFRLVLSLSSWLGLSRPHLSPSPPLSPPSSRFHHRSTE